MAFQLETDYQIFTSAMFKKDIVTGEISTAHDGDYHTSGPASSRHIRNVFPESPAVECSIWQIQTSCTHNQIEALVAGKAVVKD